MLNATVIVLILQALIASAVIAIVISIAVPLIRWTLRINDMVRNQERIIAELQRINGQSSSNNP